VHEFQIFITKESTKLKKLLADHCYH